MIVETGKSESYKQATRVETQSRFDACLEQS